MRKTYVVHSSDTAIRGATFVAVIEGRDEAERIAREASIGGRESAVIRQTDGVTVAAYHSGKAMRTTDVYVDYVRCWPEMYALGTV